MTNLEEILNVKRRNIHTQQYNMSVGEVINLYRDQELYLNPIFQRFYRWTDIQKSKLIESILLGIPIPPIYVSQREDGKWEVIDGLQRLSTILNFVGLLKNKEGEIIEPFELLGTEDVPELEDLKWDGDPSSEKCFTSTQRIDFKRSPLTIVIVKKISDFNAKYDLFQRLNTGGTTLSDQEVRNCLLVMEDETFFEYIERLAHYPSFLDAVSLSDKSLNEQENIELVLKYFIFKNIAITEIKEHNDLNSLLTSKAIEFCKQNNFDRDSEETLFKKTFDKINMAMGDKAFKKYNADKNKASGGFLISGFEAIAIGIGYNLQRHTLIDEPLIEEKCKELWTHSDFREVSGSGSNAKRRLPVLIPLGKSLFSNEN
ncbi:DUF262 domain-containing protein [Lysinibacillus tabacifolii]|uniref:DUF262 domain-containing protein n=1 Tax=Lysinibacillus tabacifolii TaxID=1173107 RepID=A0ABY2SYX6_9BACI|nr:DUF262 domain-containing protein [Lysinibacillus tabacifolii]TKI46263.1 DUF262 domain-containing protein [Lysinibacillus tabacifolii]